MAFVHYTRALVPGELIPHTWYQELVEAYRERIEVVGGTLDTGYDTEKTPMRIFNYLDLSLDEWYDEDFGEELNWSTLGQSVADELGISYTEATRELGRWAFLSSGDERDYYARLQNVNYWNVWRVAFSKIKYFGLAQSSQTNARRGCMEVDIEPGGDWETEEGLPAGEGLSPAACSQRVIDAHTAQAGTWVSGGTSSKNNAGLVDIFEQAGEFGAVGSYYSVQANLSTTETRKVFTIPAWFATHTVDLKLILGKHVTDFFAAPHNNCAADVHEDAYSDYSPNGVIEADRAVAISFDGTTINPTVSSLGDVSSGSVPLVDLISGWSGSGSITLESLITHALPTGAGTTFRNTWGVRMVGNRILADLSPELDYANGL